MSNRHSCFLFFTKGLLTILLLAVACPAMHAQLFKRKKEKQEEVVLSESEMQEFTKLFFDANKAKILGDYATAKKLFDQALRIDPTSSATRFELAKLASERGLALESIELAKAARDSDPDNIWYGHFLAQLYAETGQFDESIEIFRDLIKRQPESLENYFNLGGLLAAQGEYDDALKLYNDLEARLGPNEEISVQRQLIYLEQKDFDKALLEVEALINANPEEIRYYGMKAEILQNMDRKAEAKELYELMLFENPDNGLVLLALYEAEEAAGNRDKAEEYLQRAFAGGDLNVDLKVNILLNYLSSSILNERPEFVIKLGAALESAHPAEAKAYAIQGDVFYNLGRFEEARDKFRKAVELDANRPPIWQQILTINSQLNDFDAMLKDGETSLELFPMQPIFYLFTGVAHLQAKNTDKAVEVLESGKALVIDNKALMSQFHTSLGDAYHELGLHTESFASYDAALAIDGNNALVLNNYAYYLALRGERLDQAEKMAKKANDLVPNTPSFQDTYGWVLHVRGNHSNALFWIEDALKNGAANDPVVLEHYGDVLKALGRNPDAMRAWQQAIDAGGDSKSLRSKIEGPKAGER